MFTYFNETTVMFHASHRKCHVHCERCSDHVRSLPVISVEWTTHAHFRIAGSNSHITNNADEKFVKIKNKRTVLIYRWLIC